MLSRFRGRSAQGMRLLRHLLSLACLLASLIITDANGRHGVLSRTMGEDSSVLGLEAHKHPHHRHPEIPRGTWSLVNRTEVHPQATVPQSNFKMTALPAKGLPVGCITYAERYAKYMVADGMLGLNERKPHSKYVILLRAHAEMRWSLDLILSMRALVREAYDSGWHTWILMQLSVGPQSKPRNPAHHLSLVPPEFRSIIHPFTAEQMHREFPHVHLYIEEEKANWYDIRRRGYLGPVSFLREFPAYEFAYIVENDLRYIGKSWGHFFNAVLNAAVQAMPGNSNGMGHDGLVDLLNPPAEGQKLPDLLLFDYWVNGPATVAEYNDWGLQLNSSQWKFSHVAKAIITAYGMSRRMVEAVFKHSMDGNGGFMELFIPSLAYTDPLETVFVPLAKWNDTDSITCCTDVLSNIYDEWYLNQQCQDFTLLHPVKNANLGVWREWYVNEASQ